MKRKRVGAVNYLNTKPLIYGLENGMMRNEIELVMDYPSNIATLLLENKIDIGLIPVAVIPEMEEHYIVSDYCIGTMGKVASVCLFSDVPLNEIKTVLLDYQSRTSVALFKILLKEYWKVNPEFRSTGNNFQHNIKGTTAGLIIGDRALEQRAISPYIYDLGEAWNNYTSLPFVFAAWVSNKKISNEFVSMFNEANKFGLEHLRDVIQKNSCVFYDLETYYTKNISYILDKDKKNGIELFLSKLLP